MNSCLGLKRSKDQYRQRRRIFANRIFERAFRRKTAVVLLVCRENTLRVSQQEHKKSLRFYFRKGIRRHWCVAIGVDILISI